MEQKDGDKEEDILSLAGVDTVCLAIATTTTTAGSSTCDTHHASVGYLGDHAQELLLGCFWNVSSVVEYVARNAWTAAAAAEEEGELAYERATPKRDGLYDDTGVPLCSTARRTTVVARTRSGYLEIEAIANSNGLVN